MTDFSVGFARVARADARRRWYHDRSWLFKGLLLVAVVLLVALPLMALLDTALERGASSMLEAVISASPAIWASLWSSTAATVLAVALGAAAAAITERTDVPGRRWLRVAMLVAFIVPGYVAAMGWLAAYGPGGLLDDVFGISTAALSGPAGVVLVLAIEAMPLTYLVVAAGFATRTEPDSERAARASGAGAVMAFRTITLPLLIPVLAGAAAISFVLSMTSFGVPAVLGIPAGFTTMTTRIYRDLAFSHDAASFVRAIGLAIVLAITVAVIIGVADRLLERRRGAPSGAFGGPLGGFQSPGQGHQGARPHRRTRLGTLLVGVAMWALVIVTVMLPLVALVLTALSRAPGLAPVPANWTLDNFAAVLDTRTLSALGNSLFLAGTAALGVTLLAGLALLARRGRGAGLAGGMLSLTFAVPGSTLAIGILLAYGVAVRDGLLIILIAYLAKFWVLGYRPMAAGLDGIPADLRHAARMSGAGEVTSMRTVVMPLLRPMIVAGALMVFIFGLHEVTMSSLLYGPGSATLGVAVLNLQQLGGANLTAALALLLTLIVAIAALPLLARTGALARIGWRR